MGKRGMPGLIGAVGDISPQTRDELLHNMAQVLAHKDWYQTDFYTDSGGGLGRVGLDILNPTPQPIWNEDQSLCAFMEGEFYNSETMRRNILLRGHQLKTNSDAELLLHMYEDQGEDCVRDLDGAFVAAIWSPSSRKLTILNDRFGQIFLYYAQHHGKLCFASSVGALLVDHGLDRKIDAVGVAQFLSFAHPLDYRTLLDNVKMLPPATVLTYEDSRLTVRSYWDFQLTEDYHVHQEDWYTDRWVELFTKAVAKRVCHEDGPIGVSLSGGRDSRSILSAMEHEAHHTHAFTFGIRQSTDVRLAGRVARQKQVQWHFFELKPDFLVKEAEEGVALTDGMNSCIHMHGLANLEQVAQYVPVLFTGSFGDTLMRGPPRPDLYAVQRDEVWAKEYALGAINKGFKIGDHTALFAPSFYRKINGVVTGSFIGALKESKARLACNRWRHFMLRHHNRRLYLVGQQLIRSRLVCRTPFYDYDLVDFMLSIPPAYRLDGRLYDAGISKISQDLAQIPVADTSLPLVPCVEDGYLRLMRSLGWKVNALGLKWVRPRAAVEFADYNTWMRTVLRPWVEETLLNKRALGRGYFNPDYIRNLVAEHMAGANHARKLGVLLTLELWHRLFLD